MEYPDTGFCRNEGFPDKVWGIACTCWTNIMVSGENGVFCVDKVGWEGG
jgi:hypothetical protein